MILVLACSSCSQQTPTPSPSPAPVAASFEGQHAYNEVSAFVEIGPRVSGTEGARRAASHIGKRLDTIGITVNIHEFEADTPRGRILFRNVMGSLPGTGAGTLVIAGHYDTKSGISDTFAGANDSGSSTGLMIALAAALKASSYAPKILFAFLDGEECQSAYGPTDGLHGSRHLAANLKPREVLAVIVVDMIGDHDLRVTIPRNSSPALISLAFNAATSIGVRDRFSLHAGTILDDHVPFLKRGMPAIDLIDFQFGSAPGKNDYWHTDKDTLDKISADSLETVGRVVIHMIHALSTADENSNR
jgi:hypothetical protein